MMRRIIGPKRDEVTRGWGEIYNKEFNDLYNFPNSIWVIE
jgi:hypothetical protein